MITYKTVWHRNPEELDKTVTAMINDGWQLAGGLTLGNLTSFSAGASEVRKDVQASVAGYEYQLIWAQALTRSNR